MSEEDAGATRVGRKPEPHLTRGEKRLGMKNRSRGKGPDLWVPTLQKNCNVGGEGTPKTLGSVAVPFSASGGPLFGPRGRQKSIRDARILGRGSRDRF